MSELTERIVALQHALIDWERQLTEEPPTRDFLVFGFSSLRTIVSQVEVAAAKEDT